MPQRNVATNFTFEQQRQEINLLAADFWSQKGTVDTAAPTYLKHDGSNNFTGQTLAVPNAFTINSNSGSGTVTIAGNLDVTGTTTTVSSANLEVTDKNILIAKGSTSDSQADGAGITIDSGTDITFNFVDAKDALVSSIGLEGTTFLKAPYGQFIGSGTPTGGQGVEINAPDTNTGQISSYDRANTAYKELRVKGSSVGIYGGTSNTLAGTFNSTGLTMGTGKTITSGNITISTDTDASFFINTTNANGAHLRIQTSGTNKTFLGQASGIAGTLGGADDFAIRSAEDIVFSTNNNNTADVKIDTSGQIGLANTSPDAWNTSYKSLQIYDGAVLYGSADDSFVGLGANHYLDTNGNFKYSNADFASRFYQVNGNFYFESASSGTAGNTFSFTERLRFENDGKIVVDGNTTGTVCYLKNNNTTDGFGLRVEGGGTTADRYSLAVFNAAGEEKFRVNADGKIGINEQFPQSLLDIHDSAAANDTPEIRIESFRPTIRFADRSSSQADSEICGDHGLQFRISEESNNDTALTERLRITPEGYLHLGGVSQGTNKVGGQNVTGQDFNPIFKLLTQTNNTWLMQLRSDTSTGSNGIFMRAGSGTDDYTLYLTGNDEANKHLLVRGDGYVQKPKNPGFAVQATPTSTNFTNYNNSWHSFGTIHYNNGNHYDNASGRFTAPIDGYYFFTCGLWCSNSDDSTGSYVLTLLRENANGGGDITFAGASHRTQNNQLTCSGGIYMTAGQTVRIEFNGSIVSSTPRNYFTGCLIG